MEFLLQHPSFQYSGLVSFRIDWFDLLVVQGTLKRVVSSTTVQKASVLHCLTFFMVQLSHLIFELKNLGDEGELCFPGGSVELRVMWVRSLVREDPLEEGMATHSSIFAWGISWRGACGLQPIGLLRVRHD